MSGGDALTSSLRDRVVARLGVGGAAQPCLAGLRAVYAAWCRHVPFDNVRKLVALRTAAPGPLPGAEAADFFEHWLAHGTGGTCWPSSNALHSLIRALGFDARRVAGSMHDAGPLNHGSVAVRIEAAEWLVDSSMLTNAPLRLDSRGATFDDGIVAAEVERVDGAYRVWVRAAPNERHVPCRILDGAVDGLFYGQQYEASREESPFNRRVYARRNRPDEMVVLGGFTRFSKTAAGMTRRDLSIHEIPQALREDFGISAEMLRAFISCGALHASMEPPPPSPARAASLPPSLRTTAR